MCVPRVPRSPVDARERAHGASCARRGSDAPRDRSAARRAYRHARQVEENHLANQRAWEQLEAGLRSAPDAAEPLYSLELGSSHTRGRRVRPRQPHLVLGDVEREECRRRIATAASCGTSFAAYRRFSVAPAGIREDRLVCQRFCGTRACEHCDEQIRLRECARVQGRWRQFVTLGVPAAHLSCRQAWFRIRRARALLFKRLERHVERPDAWAVRVWDSDALFAWITRRATTQGRLRLSPLDYAWTLEPHQSGYPHLHFVLNTTFIHFGWLRKVWSECLGRNVRWIKVKDVWDSSGTCRYLSKYISKTTFTLDLCAVMYRQRLWGTSLPMPERKPAEWIEEAGTAPDAAKAQAERPDAWSAEDGFVVSGARAGRYATWSRTWSPGDSGDAWLWRSMAEGRWDGPAARRPAGRPPSARGVSLWPLADLILEIVYRYMSVPWTLTRCVKVGQTFASESEAA